MPDDWEDTSFAAEWTRVLLRGNPTREEQLEILLALLKETYRAGRPILDLGCGSGIVEEMIFKKISGVRVVGVDSSQAMLDLAAERLQPWSTHLQLIQADLGDIESVKFPESSFGMVISVQTLHNVSHTIKKRVSGRIHGMLDPLGVVYILDRIRVDSRELFDQFRIVWNRLEIVHETTIDEGSTYPEHAQILREKGDDPASLGELLRWLSNAGFVATCIHVHGNRALIVGRTRQAQLRAKCDFVVC